jgi:hypothetical protein
MTYLLRRDVWLDFTARGLRPSDIPKDLRMGATNRLKPKWKQSCIIVNGFSNSSTRTWPFARSEFACA